MNAAELAGRFLAGLVCFGGVGIGFVYLVMRGTRTAPRSHRLAMLSLALGLAFFFMICISPKGRFGNFGIGLALAALSLVMSLGGIGAGIAALVIRRSDHGSGLALPIMGIVASSCHLVLGFLAFVAMMGFAPPDPTDTSRSWSYVSPEHGFRLLLPTTAWQQYRTDDGKVGFGHAMPRMLAVIDTVETNATEEGFRAAAAQLRRVTEESNKRRQSARHHEGINRAGHPYHLATFTDDGTKGDVFVAAGVIWIKSKGLLLHIIFEGQPEALSETFKENEQETFEKSAQFIVELVD